MKKLLGFLVLASIVSGPAFAADMPLKAPLAPVPMAFNWSGYYVGINGGYGWNASTGDAFCTTPVPAAIVGGPGCSVALPGTLSPQGGFFGAQAGYNYQTGIFVLGLEADIQWSGIKASVSVPVACCLPAPVAAAGVNTTSQSLDWFGTVRGRAGITPWDRTLLYATGGLIYGQESVSQLLVFPLVTYGPVSSASTHVGFTVGGGGEYALTKNVTAKIEALYYDMGSETIGFLSPVTLFRESATFNYKGTLLRGGLNWKF